MKLQEFVSSLDKELKMGPPLLEALGNADIFYEMQYKEVKIVANVSPALNDIITFPARMVLRPNLQAEILFCGPCRGHCHLVSLPLLVAVKSQDPL